MTQPRPLRDDLGFLLAVSRARVIPAVNGALRGAGLNVRSYSVLALACEREDVSQRELADELRLDPSQIVAIVDGLEDAGLVRRHVSTTDRRMRAVVATPEGRTVHAAATDSVVTTEDELLGELSPTEQDALRALLTRIADGDRTRALT